MSIFGSIKEIIDEIEYVNEEFYKFLKYKFHSNQGNYYKFIGNEEKAKKNFNLAEATYIKSKDYLSASKGIIEEKEIISDENSDVDSMQAENALKDLEIHLNENENLEIKNRFVKLKISPKNAKEYFLLPSKEIRILLSEIERKIIIINENEKNTKPYEHLQKLFNLYETIEYQKKIKFMEHIIVSQSKDLVYGDTVTTKQSINKRWQDLSREFFPDKTEWKDESDKKISTDFFCFITKLKIEIIAEITRKASNSDAEMKTYEEEGNYYSKRASEYDEIINSKREKPISLKKDFKILNYNSVANLTYSELDSYRNQNANKAYEYYRSACKIADKNKILEKRVKLRQNMATCLDIADSYLEARVSALSAIYLILKNPFKSTGRLLKDAQDFYKKLKYNDIEEDSDKKISTNLVHLDTSLGLFLSESCSEIDLSSRVEAVTENLRDITRSLILRPNEKVMNNNAIFSMMTEILSWGWSWGWGWGDLFKRYPQTKFQKHIERFKLCVLIRDAINDYKKGNINSFFEKLQTKVKIDKGTKSIKILDYKLKTIKPDSIISLLLSHGTHSHVIAYLLNLIGEALISGKLEYENRNINDFLCQAITVFEATYDRTENILTQKAKEADLKIAEIKKNYLTSFLLNPIYSIITINFESSLAEMQNTAKINIALIRIMQNDFDASKRILKDVKEYTEKNYSLLSSQKTRIERLEDFISILDDKYIHEDDFPDKKEDMHEPKMIEMKEYLRFLKKQLDITHEENSKSKIYLDISEVYANKAKNSEAENYLESLKYWFDAKLNCRLSYDLNKQDSEVLIKYVNSVIKLNDFTLAKKLLLDNEKILQENSDYWYFRGILEKKKFHYSKACDHLVKSLKINNFTELNKEEIEKEKKLVEHLSKRDQKVEEKYEKSKQLTLDYTKTENRKNESKYKILSIDGGGMRGIIPAFWLNEIEKRTNKPICKLFDMISGTSTGAIIAAGLSVPANNDASKPLFRAYEIMDIYKKSGKQIFSKSFTSKVLEVVNNCVYPISIASNIFNGVNNCVYPIYTDDGRLNTFKEYFKETTLDQSLTELLIPAVNEKFINLPHEFTRYDAKADTFKNSTYVDALMATSAAPTFFPPYKIGDNMFIDGGVQANNPSQLAYNMASKHIDSRNIYLLSMGTGDYIPAISDTNLRGLLFWGYNLKDVILPAQPGTCDQSMNSMLHERYKRWQIWYENPILLDDYNEDSVDKMLNMANQYFEEMFSDEDSFRELLKFLDVE